MRKVVGIVLMVKDEASDILAWAAWYRMLGADALMVYDDDSADGTLELLTQASANFDIRLHRALGPRDASFDQRQWASYRHALATYRDEFDWLGFFDADEYLALPGDSGLRQFLARFGHADQIAINWCNYGSSGHRLKPEEPPPLAYTWHGGADRRINRHVKCLVRPEAVGPRWICVHAFDVEPARAVLANGAPIVWSETMGILAGPPDWSAAKLMHYQCRSMEHFIERLKCQPALRRIPGLWEAYDLHDEEDTSPHLLAARLHAGIAVLRAQAPPYWQVDLKMFSPIWEIRIPGPARNLILAVSIDGESWAELDDWRPDAHAPARWSGAGAGWGRYVRVTQAEPGPLVLENLEVLTTRARE